MHFRSLQPRLTFDYFLRVTVRCECAFSIYDEAWLLLIDFVAQTLLGIDANHASGIPSPRYRITDFIKPDELKQKFEAIP